jgi:LPXTG-site transpeptidase (sortase) family protein
MKKAFGTVLILLIIVTGLSLLAYPALSNFRSESGGSRAVKEYADKIGQLQPAAGSAEFARAEEYNRALYQNSVGAEPASVSASDYGFMLNPSADGMMGYIDIPAISCRLPIYHGTQASTLESYVGHLPSSSLPTGGESTHCVLTGHTGMPSAKLLSDLDKVKTGDRFTLTVLDRKLTYEVDSIRVVRPDETQALAIVEGEDYCTLVTCTPYGVNTHRLLVRGKRVSEAAPVEADVSDSLVDYLIHDPVMLSLAVILIMLMITFAVTRRGREQ